MSRARVTLAGLLAAAALGGCTNGVVYSDAGLPPEPDPPAATTPAAPARAATTASAQGGEHAGHPGHETGEAAAPSGRAADPSATLPAAAP